MAVQQYNFVGLWCFDLAGMAQTNHVFGVFTFGVVKHASLAHHEGTESLFAQAAQDVTCWDVGITVRTAAMFVRRKNGWRNLAKLIVAQWSGRSQAVLIAAKVGCQLMSAGHENVLKVTWLKNKKALLP